nr:immunoglobulin heavy chain junction region [Macaca mulatta]MPN73605.1 immunoglobulin heavy chain junction region [Macaca mulatta]MPN73711.1 immunoglobulin heavy chain junction region [Macaca mulatta]MPN75268.1 immunoglobulin heavy chain junction region [Macaca mulatta]MPN79111.1 immunoglobulin heavy chain junction region [Macaca mulatta]
CHNEGENW